VNLLSTLVKAGVVSANGTPLGAGATAKEEADKVQPADLERVSSRAYRKSILSQKIKLTSAEVTK
jgi:pre-mRNA cleavage complex 2 protein Pcf11